MNRTGKKTLDARQKAERLAKSMGVEIFAGGGEVTATIPAGHVFNASDCHSVVCAPEEHEGGMRAAWTSMAQQLSEGMRRCDLDGCEYCDR
jgi:hypothetical protein